ncbi:hypothetical protein [Kingella oralis]|uniref:hypothetical protein n=1 Tax=Kingella oralis TaxID=505 RepID=UPI0034E46C98
MDNPLPTLRAQTLFRLPKPLNHRPAQTRAQRLGSLKTPPRAPPTACSQAVRFSQNQQGHSHENHHRARFL